MQEAFSACNLQVSQFFPKKLLDTYVFTYFSLKDLEQIFIYVIPSSLISVVALFIFFMQPPLSLPSIILAYAQKNK